MNVLELKGYWFLPEDHCNRIPGVLTYNDKDGITLKLIGGFQNLNYDIVLGDIGDNRRITLYGAFVLRRTGFTQPIEMDLTANILFDGAWINSIKDMRIYSANIKCRYSELWYGKHGYKHIDSLNFEIDQPATLNVDLNSKSTLKIRLVTNRNLTRNSTPQIILTDKTYFELNWRQGLSFKKAIENTLHLLNFLILSIQMPSYIEDFILVFKLKGNRVTKYNVKVFYSHVYMPTAQVAHPSNLLLPYSCIEATFPTIIKEWFVIKEKLQTSLTPYMANFHSKYSYVSDKFLNLTTSLEAFHRDFINSGNIHFANRVKWILSQYSKTYNAKIKIRSIPKIAVEIKNKRNDWTHSNSLTSDPKISMRIHNLSELITVVMACAFFEEIGVDRKVLKTNILRSNRYKNFNKH